MKFELLFAKEYLVPRRKALSRAIIGTLSVAVISMVVWLVLLFVSITDGIQNRWLGYLTALKAPIQIVPTQKYYHSYYYKIDEFASASDYTRKTLGEKKDALSDPFDPDFDAELPAHLPPPDVDSRGNFLAPAKRLFASLDEMHLRVEDYECSPVVLQMQVGDGISRSNFTQAIYLSSFSGKSHEIYSKVLPPEVRDLKDWSHVEIEEVEVGPHATVPIEMLPENVPFHGNVIFTGGKLSHAILTDTSGTLKRIGSDLFYENDNQTFVVRSPLLLNETFKAKVINDEVVIPLQGKQLRGVMPLSSLKITKFKPHRSFEKKPSKAPPWIYQVGDEYQLPNDGILLPKNFQETGLSVGDIGHAIYASSSSGTMMEQRIPVKVAGFYDAGVWSIGNRVGFVSHDLVRHINASGNALPIDNTLVNGLHIWLDDINQTKEMVSAIKDKLADAGIGSYFTVTPYYEYDYAKEMLMQFRSDQNLFMIVGILILIVACCNIISLLMLLVNDKKKEIGTLQAMGASKGMIATIFGLCGGFLGLISALIGTILGVITLKNINGLVAFLSKIQGHDMFSATYYGHSLPETISFKAILFIAIVTPLISLLAALIPAMKAVKLKPSQILRNE
ncbi:MAG: hypothetical protein SP1CHLAM54_08790 [Chlamydiia bacterium]|nr:hypothetical protein [Chlamydiia bacterium]MCH9615785.1 hypothetical protein [Chlamydiia bacterium]MCH9628812.1 hypothetical protein [Chlamydiia bacterium]